MSRDGRPWPSRSRFQPRLNQQLDALTPPDLTGLVSYALEAPILSAAQARARSLIASGYRSDGMDPPPSCRDAHTPPPPGAAAELFEDLQVLAFAAETVRQHTIDPSRAARDLLSSIDHVLDLTASDPWILDPVIDHVRTAEATYTQTPAKLQRIMKRLLDAHTGHDTAPDAEAMLRSIRRRSK